LEKFHARPAEQSGACVVENQNATWLGRMSSRAQKYREHAAECVLLAHSITGSEEKAALLNMAQMWEKLAALAEAEEKREKE
jgi:hypothetical protein